MKYMPLVARILLGLTFAGLGTVGLLQLGEPQGLEPNAEAFMTGLIGSGYFWPFLKVTEIVCGLLLLAGLYVPLALVVLAPIVINIVAFHLFLAFGPGAVPGFLALALGIYLAYCYRSSYRGVLQRKAPLG
jgi:uncharacterized membrane protein YphA (DoxX/SURF4 family)